MTEPVIVSKVANALVEDARASPGLDAAVRGAGWHGAGIGWVLARFRAHHGGLWVGGRLTLTATRLEFHPNGVNRLANRGSLDVAIDLREVTGPVAVLPGVLTKIIAVPLGSRVVKVRCWGAAKTADTIQRAVTATRRQDGWS